MVRKSKNIRSRGKIKLSSYFKKLNDGDSVALVVEGGVKATFPKRLQGLSGKVKESRGKFKVVEIKDGSKMKTYIVHPVHLKKL